MPFDANLVLHDGTAITATITPTSLTRTSGSIVLNIKKSPAKGLAAVMIVAADLAEANDTMQVSIQECATVDGTYVEVTRFPLLTKGTGMPGTYIRRFDTNKGFVRALITCVDSDSGGDFTVTGVYILLAYHPFTYL